MDEPREPENEDRLALVAQYGLGWYVGGSHATVYAFLYENQVYCPEHPPAPQEADWPEVGICRWHRGHWATAVWLTPRDGKSYCLEHLQRIVAIATWKP